MILTSENALQAVLFLGGVIGIYVLAVGLRYQFVKKRGARSPFVEEFLRLPGHSERNRRLDLFESLADNYNLFLLSAVLLIFSALFFHLWLSILCLGVALAGGTFALKKAFVLHTGIRHANLRCDGEEYTGQELNYLWSKGAHVFHDIPFGGDNIDHLVVGLDKIFVVETVAIEKIRKSSIDSDTDSTVLFDGQKLVFPHCKTRDPIERAVTRCDFIHKCIKEECAIDFQVMPVVAIPGWFVDIGKKQKAEILVINPKRGAGLKAWLGQMRNQAERAKVLSYVSFVARSIPPSSRRTDSSADDQYEFWLSPRYRDRIMRD